MALTVLKTQVETLNCLFCWYTSGRCATISRTWKEAVCQWRMQLGELDQINCPDINDAILNVVAKSCPRLQSIDLSMDRRTDDSGFRRLRIVKTTAEAFTDVAKSCPLLKEISLANDMFLACAESPVRNMDDFLLPFSGTAPT